MGRDFKTSQVNNSRLLTVIAFVWLPILKLREKLLVLREVTVVGTWFKGDIDNSGGFGVNEGDQIHSHHTYLSVVVAPYFFV